MDDVEPAEEVAPSRAVLAAEKLMGSVETLANETRDLRQQNKKHQFLIRLLGISVAFDLVLSGALGWIGVTAVNASDQAAAAATAAATNQRNFCIASNETRKSQVDLWTYVLGQSPTPAGQEATRENFRDYVAEVFKQRDCR